MRKYLHVTSVLKMKSKHKLVLMLSIVILVSYYIFNNNLIDRNKISSMLTSEYITVGIGNYSTSFSPVWINVKVNGKTIHSGFMRKALSGKNMMFYDLILSESTINVEVVSYSFFQKTVRSVILELSDDERNIEVALLHNEELGNKDVIDIRKIKGIWVID